MDTDSNLDIPVSLDTVGFREDRSGDSQNRSIMHANSSEEDQQDRQNTKYANLPRGSFFTTGSLPQKGTKQEEMKYRKIAKEKHSIQFKGILKSRSSELANQNKMVNIKPVPSNLLKDTSHAVLNNMPQKTNISIRDLTINTDSNIQSVDQPKLALGVHNDVTNQDNENSPSSSSLSPPLPRSSSLRVRHEANISEMVILPTDILSLLPDVMVLRPANSSRPQRKLDQLRNPLIRVINEIYQQLQPNQQGKITVEQLEKVIMFTITANCVTL